MATDVRIKEQLPDLTRRIVETYHDVPTIQYLGHCALPKYETVISACEDLKEILYPGYRRRENLHLGNVTYHVGDLIDGLHDKLTVQIGRALRHSVATRSGTAVQGSDHAPFPSGAQHCVDEADFEALGQAKAVEFLERIPALRRVLATDVQAAYDGDPAVRTLDEVIFCYPGLEAVTIHRLAHILHRLDVPLIPRMMAEWAHARTGIDIHPGATIGDHFFIDHGTGVVIGETCEIGSHVKLYQGVTLGALSFQTDGEGNLIRGTKRHPTIEDRVVIYANATVLGGATRVGHDSVIGSNVWLTRSIDPRTTVVLERPKLRMRGEMPPSPEGDYQI
ncbi:MAG: serine acetyltransferase [Planctomycetota bacterium]|nr:MAG: serine acetyltransferase [Planctomycetota bacterium]